MAQATRQYGNNLSVFTVDGNALVTLISDATIDFSYTMVDATVLNDAATTNIPNRQEYRIGFTLVYDKSDAGIAALLGAVGDPEGVAFSVTAAATGQVYSGTGILSSGTHNIPDGGQTLAFEIIPNGTLLTV